MADSILDLVGCAILAASGPVVLRVFWVVEEVLKRGRKHIDRQHFYADVAREVAGRQKVIVILFGEEELLGEMLFGQTGAHASLGDETAKRGVCAT